MKKQLFSFLLLLTFAIAVPAQGSDGSAVVKNLRKHVSYLASDELEGRRTGDKGATFAAGYVANMFARYKLKAGVVKSDNGKTRPGFLQSFPYVAGVTLGDASSLEITDTKNRSEATAKDEWAPLGLSPNADIPFTNVVFAGYGITSERLKYDDYKGLDVAGKLVLAFDGNPDPDNPHSFFGFFNAHAKAKIAKEKGAKGLILISRADDFAKDKLAMRFNQTLGETALPTLVISRQFAAKVLEMEPPALEGQQKILNASATGKSDPSGTTGLKGKTLLANIKIDLEKKNVDAYNVIGVLEGRDPRLKNEIIVIGAHYDHLGRGGSGSLAINSTDIHHGADDNASGTSAMLELARRFSRTRTNKRTIVFMAFGAEEEGLIGSKYWVNNPTVPLANVVAMINMDMIGRLKDRKLTVGGIGTATNWKRIVETTNAQIALGSGANLTLALKDKVESALKKNGFTQTSVDVNADVITLKGIVAKGKLAEAVKTAQQTIVRSKTDAIVRNEIKESAEVRSNPAPANSNFSRFNLQLNQDGFGPSDHSSFYGKKIPVLFFFTGTHVDYHKPSDTAEKVNYFGLERITGFVSDIVKKIDKNPSRPVYTVAKSSGMRGGRRGFSVSLGTVPSYADGNNDGLVLDGVRNESPAAKSGLKPGDKIVKLAGKEIRNISDYVFVLGSMKPDKEYEVVVMRGNEKLSLKIVPKKR